MNKQEFILKAFKNTFEVFLESSSDAIVIVNNRGEIVYHNPQLESMFKFSDRDLQSGNIDMLIPDSFHKKHKSHQARYFKTPKILQMKSRMELFGKKKDITTFPVEISLVPIDKEGQLVVASIRDVTEQKNAKDQLLESEERFRKIFEDGPIGISVIDKDAKPVRVNEELSKILGYTKDELMELTYRDITHPDDIEKTRIKVEQLLSGKIPNYTLEKRFIRKDKKVIWVNISATVIRDKKENVMYGIGLVEDITVRKKVQEELKRSRDEMSLMLNTLSLVSYKCTATPNYSSIYISENTKELTGYTVKAFFSSPTFWSDHLHPDDKKRVLDTHHGIQKSGQIKLEYRWRIKDGSYKWFYDNMILVKNDNGEADYIVGMWLDITDQKKAQRAIEKNEALLSEAQQISHLGNWDWDIITGELKWSDEIYRIFGLEINEFGASYEAFLNTIHPDDREMVIKAVNEAVNNGMPYSVDHRIITPSGKVKYVHEQGRVYYNKSGKAVRMIGTVQDITRRKDAEQQLVDKQKELSERNFELDQIVHKTSHDLRAPLSSILGLINVIELEKDPDYNYYLGLIKSRINKLDGFVKSMLNYTMASRTKTNWEPLDFDVIINDCIKDLEFIPDYEKIDVKTTISGDANFVSDYLRLQLIFNNIITNAFKFMNPNVEQSYLKIKIDIAEKWAKINFKDNGVGVDKKYLDNVFDMFFRASYKSNSSGLGLYIVKQSVEKLKGEINIKSTLGKSTEINIKLPNNPTITN